MQAPGPTPKQLHQEPHINPKGKKKRSPAKKKDLVAGLGMAMLIIGLCMLALVGINYSEIRKFEKKGKKIHARIYDKETRREWRSSGRNSGMKTIYYLKVSFWIREEPEAPPEKTEPDSALTALEKIERILDDIKYVPGELTLTEVEVHDDHYYHYRDSSNAWIYFMPDDPEEAMLVDKAEDYPVRNLAGVSVFVALAGAVVLGLGLYFRV